MKMPVHLLSYWYDRRAVSAVEFALVFPLMLLLLFGGFETSQLLQVNRKMTNVAATASDLVAQATVITNADRDDIFNAAAAIVTPFSPANLSIVITSIQNNAGTVSVAWSDGYHAQPRTSVPSDLPSGIVEPGTSIIMAETVYTYTSPAGQFFTNGITMRDVFFDRPRRSVAVGRQP